MNTALLVQYGIPALVGVVAAVVGHWNGKRVARKSPGTPAVVAPSLPAVVGGAKNLWSDPVVQLFFSKLIAAAQASGHAAMDAAIVKLLPGLAPAVPTINKVVDTVENKVINAGQKT